MSWQRKGRILIVDDTPTNIHMLVEILKNEYAIMVAKDGPTALRLASSDHPPDVILMDVVMPDMDGYEVCRLLKQNPKTRDIPLVFVSSQSEKGNEARGLSLGAIDYITKPFKPSLILTRIRNHLELKRHRDNLEEIVHNRTHELALTRQVTIEALASLAEWRDPETGGHIRRTQNYVLTLGQYLQNQNDYSERSLLIEGDALEQIYLSAPLHDVGKVAIPDSILQKPGELTQEESKQMRTHTTIGRNALASAEKKFSTVSSFLRTAKEIAYSHHERWDGKGYPEGIQGKDIPLPARLMAVADVYDALTSKRAYKEAMPHKKAMLLLKEGKDKHFDPEIINAALTIQDNFEKIAKELLD